MNFNTLLKQSEEREKLSIKKQQECESDGGHVRAKVVTVNGKPAFKCWCGFSAPATAPIWKKVYQCCYCLGDIVEYPDLVIAPDELVCDECKQEQKQMNTKPQSQRIHK